MGNNFVIDNNIRHYDLERDVIDIIFGHPDYSEAMRNAAFEGQIETVKRCKEYGATDYDEAMRNASMGGHIEIVKLCKKWGATKYDEAMIHAALYGHIEIVVLCKEWGATNYNEAMQGAAWGGWSEVHRDSPEIIRLCRGWLGYDEIHDELLRHHHKRYFYRKIHDELLPIAWHPDRAWDWCFDEEQKGNVSVEVVESSGHLRKCPEVIAGTLLMTSLCRIRGNSLARILSDAS